MNTPALPALIPDGTVNVRSNPDRRGLPWYLVELGRPSYVKRFNLSRSEAVQLIAKLRELGIDG